MSCSSADFTRALEHSRRQVAKYERMALVDPVYRGQLRSAQIASEALQLVRQHLMEGVVLGRVDVLRTQARIPTAEGATVSR